MEKSKILELRKKGTLLKPTVNIGKNGLTDSSIKQIRDVLKKKKLIKVKINKGALDEFPSKNDLTDMIVEKTGGILVDFRGFSIVLFYQKS